MIKNFAFSTFFTLILFAGFQAQAATCSTNGASTNYNAAGAWGCGHVPTSSDDLSISHSVTSATSIGYQWGPQTITINSGGYLKISGNALLQGTVNIVINNGGTFEVTGILTTQNGGPTITVNNGGTLKVGTLQVNYGSTVTVASGGTANVTTLNTGNDGTALFNNNGTLNVSGNMTSTGGPITNTGTVNLTGDLTVTNSGTAKLTSSGTFKVGGNVYAGNTIQLNPGSGVDSNMTVTGSFYSQTNENIVIGTNGAATPYANLIVLTNLEATGGGDITINKNGRLVVKKDVKDNGGGDSRFKVNNGGQVYIGGNLTYTGNGSPITNANPSTPAAPEYGLYVNGTTSVNTGSGMTVPGNLGTKQDMHDYDLPFYNFVLGIPNGPLPVKLVYFKTEGSGTSVQLSWATSSEKNFRYFRIERASQDLVFTTIGEVEAKGSSTLTKYSFTDDRPLNGSNYYRLKMIDLDELFEYSPVVTASRRAVSAVNVYPNPVTDKLFTIELNDVMDTPAQVTVLDGSGTQVLRAELESNTTAFQLPQNISPGLYYLRISSGHGQQIIKVAVR
ncbi:MAG TPA: T9SS type A sorting domain-containing protein [Chryseolinea sp.]